MNEMKSYAFDLKALFLFVNLHRNKILSDLTLFIYNENKEQRAKNKKVLTTKHETFRFIIRNKCVKPTMELDLRNRPKKKRSVAALGFLKVFETLFLFENLH